MGSVIRVRQRETPALCDTWEELSGPTRLRCRYRLDDRSQVLPFVELIMEYEDRVQHHGAIIIHGRDVVVEIRTQGLETLTSRDHEYAAQLDLIRQQLRQGWGDYVNDPGQTDYSALASTVRDQLNVGYTDEEEVYDI